MFPEMVDYIIMAITYSCIFSYFISSHCNRIWYVTVCLILRTCQLNTHMTTILETLVTNSS